MRFSPALSVRADKRNDEFEMGWKCDLVWCREWRSRFLHGASHDKTARCSGRNDEICCYYIKTKGQLDLPAFGFD